MVAFNQGVPHQTKAFLSSSDSTVTQDPFAGWPYFKNPAYGRTLEDEDIRRKYEMLTYTSGLVFAWLSSISFALSRQLNAHGSDSQLGAHPVALSGAFLVSCWFSYSNDRLSFNVLGD